MKLVTIEDESKYPVIVYTEMDNDCIKIKARKGLETYLLFTVNKDGTFTRYTQFGNHFDNLGFQVDEMGKIKER